MQREGATGVHQNLHTGARVEHGDQMRHVSHARRLIDGDALGVDGVHVVVPIVQVLLVGDDEDLIEPTTLRRADAKLDNRGDVIADGHRGQQRGRCARIGLLEAAVHLELVDGRVDVREHVLALPVEGVVQLVVGYDVRVTEDRTWWRTWTFRLNRIH